MLQYCTLPGLRPFWILHCDFGLPSRLFTRHPFRARISAQNTPALSCRQPNSSHAATFGHRSQKHPLVILPRSPLLDSPPNRPRTSSSSAVSISSVASSIASPIVASHSPSRHLTVMSSHLVVSPSCHLIMSSRRHVLSCRHASRHPPAPMLPCATSRGLARQPTQFLVRSMLAARRLRGAAAVSARERIIRLRSAPSADVRRAHRACRRQSRA